MCINRDIFSALVKFLPPYKINVLLFAPPLTVAAKACVGIIWGLCNRKEGNCREKPNLLLYAKYVFYAEIRPDLALIHFLFFPY